jgi:hypothetical protein
MGQIGDIYRKRVGEMIDRISDNGVLELTMADIRQGIRFDDATASDIRYSMEPMSRANIALLFHESRVKVLKARIRLEMVNA